MSSSRTPLDVAADILFYAPVGLAIQVSKAIPELAESGRSRLAAPLAAARMVGEMTVDQRRRDLADRFRKATEPYFGGSGADDVRTGSTDRAERAEPTSSADRTRPTGSAGGGTTFANIPLVHDLAIPGYSTLSAPQVVAHLEGLSKDELEAIAAYESSTRRRKTVLSRVEQLIADQA